MRLPRPSLAAIVPATLASALAAAALVAVPSLTSSSPSAQAPTNPAAAPVAAAARRQAGNPVTPGDFTGYGFDQCLTPDQPTMDRWLTHSPFLAVGVYSSGGQRACRNQPHLTPEWVATQQRKGWRILLITLGPQAACQPRFPRYGEPDISTRPGDDGSYATAREQGRAEALDAIAAAERLGVAKGSTLWYDLEGFDLSNTRCRESSLAFVSGWSWRLQQEGWASGMYSSAGSGIVMVDRARRQGRTDVTLPEYLWIARWDGVANTSTTYISEEGWNPHRRVKQYRGGHDETWGGVTINIDSNFLDVGRGSVAPAEEVCGGVRVGFRDYYPFRIGTTRTRQVRALQCLLQVRGMYDGPLDGVFDEPVAAAADRFLADRGLPLGRGTWTLRSWVGLLSDGPTRVLKFGSAGSEVRRVQRALNAAGAGRLRPDGVLDLDDSQAVRAYQRAVGLKPTGVVAAATWKRLRAGRL